jgi:hypothetical protein
MAFVMGTEASGTEVACAAKARPEYGVGQPEHGEGQLECSEVEGHLLAESPMQPE